MKCVSDCENSADCKKLFTSKRGTITSTLTDDFTFAKMNLNARQWWFVLSVSDGVLTKYVMIRNRLDDSFLYLTRS